MKDAAGVLGAAKKQLFGRYPVDAFWAIPWYLPLLGGLERVFAITIQIALGLLVVRSLTHRNVGWLLAAIGAHALVDSVTLFLAGLGWSPLALEGIMLLFALGGLALILALQSSEPRAHTQVRGVLG